MQTNSYPLRKVVRRFYEDLDAGNGITARVPREELECGHVMRPRSDHYGETNAYRRRCRRCALGVQ